MDEAKSIFNREVKFLKDGVKNSKNPYHTFSFSSFSPSFPELRTIVLRMVTLDPLCIYFNTDYRSPKINQLRKNKYCSALFYNQERGVQFRLKCKSILNYNNDFSRKVWNKTPLQSRKCYMGPFPPSKKIDEWHPNFPVEYSKKDPDLLRSEDGYINFVNIKLEVMESEILELHHNGHVRILFKGSNMLYLSP